MALGNKTPQEYALFAMPSLQAKGVAPVESYPWIPITKPEHFTVEAVTQLNWQTFGSLPLSKSF